MLRDLKIEMGGFLSLVVVYTHSQHTFIFKHHVKVNLASDDPFKGSSQNHRGL